MNPVIRWQIVSPQPKEATSFYANLFGWRVTDQNEIDTGTGRGIDGSVWPAPPEARDFVQLFVAVDDVDRTIARATAVGASVIVPKTAMPDGHFVAILRDPHGLSFGIVSHSD